MMYEAASAAARLKGRPWRLTRNDSAAMWANESVESTAVGAKPSRSGPPNQATARWAGAPTSSNRFAIGDMSESVSLTSKISRRGGRDRPDWRGDQH